MCEDLILSGLRSKKEEKNTDTFLQFIPSLSFHYWPCPLAAAKVLALVVVRMQACSHSPII